VKHEDLDEKRGGEVVSQRGANLGTKIPRAGFSFSPLLRVVNSANLTNVRGMVPVPECSGDRKRIIKEREQDFGQVAECKIIHRTGSPIMLTSKVGVQPWLA